MKLLSIFAVALLVAHAKSMTLAEHKSMLIGIAQECKVTEDASDDDMGRLVSKKAPETPEGKCLFACIMEGLGAIENGELNTDGMVDFARANAAGDASKIQIAKELAEECGAIKEADRCELAYKMGGCFKMGAIKRGIDFGF